MSEQIPTEDEMRLTVKPRALTYSPPEYWIAVGGKGPLGSQWEDKPHRLVYDLLAANLRANDELTSLRASQAALVEKAEAFRVAMIESGATHKVPQDTFFPQLRALEAALAQSQERTSV